MPPVRPAGALRSHARELAWLVVAPLAGLAGARLMGYDDRAVLAVANAATPLVYLPAYAAMAVGVATRRPFLAGVATAVVAAHLVWALPEFKPARPVSEATRQAPHVRILSANLRFTATDWDALGAEIRATDADVVVLQELTPANLAVLRRAGAFQSFPHELVDPRSRSFGSGIWGRTPLKDAESWDVAGQPMTRAVIEVGGEPVRVVNVHTRSPLAGGRALWAAQLKALAELVEAEPLPMIMAGDFNATFGHEGFRHILDQGMRDAHVDVGRGWATTWPRTFPFVPPLFRLDHVLVSEGVVALSVGEGQGKGSDHRPVLADLAVTA